MRRLFVAILLIMAIAVSSCSTKTNDELYEFVSRQEHDSNLFGWWEPADPDNFHAYFDGDSFKMTYATIDQDGTLQQKKGTTYWYTLNGKLFTIKAATPLTGPIDSSFEYMISDDGNTILGKDSENWIEIYYKIEQP